MTPMTKVTITLKDEDQHFIEAAMKTGRYVTESEAVADAISELRARGVAPDPVCGIPSQD